MEPRPAPTVNRQRSESVLPAGRKLVIEPESQPPVTAGIAPVQPESAARSAPEQSDRTSMGPSMTPDVDLGRVRLPRSAPSR